MVDRIDLFMPIKSQYGALHHFTQKLGEAFKEIGISCRILKAEKDKPDLFFDQLLKDPPQCTLSFNGLLPDDKGNFFCDMAHIPHVAFIVDSPNQYFALAKSPNTIVASVDRFYADFFRSLNCAHVLFMPHGVEKSAIIAERTKDPLYDVVMLGTGMDYEAIRKEWDARFPRALCKLMDEVVEVCFSQQQTSYIQAFAEAITFSGGQFDGISTKDIDYPTVFHYLETYIRAKDRVELVKSIEDAKVDIFGLGGEIWRKYLGKQSPHVIHDSIPFEQTYDIMERSKIVLNSSPHLKNGSHERVFGGIASGALVITGESTFFRTIFKEEESILFYPYNHHKKASKWVSKYLQDEKARREVVKKGLEIVRNHTWVNRARELVSALKPIVG